MPCDLLGKEIRTLPMRPPAMPSKEFSISSISAVKSSSAKGLRTTPQVFFLGIDSANGDPRLPALISPSIQSTAPPTFPKAHPTPSLLWPPPKFPKAPTNRSCGAFPATTLIKSPMVPPSPASLRKKTPTLTFSMHPSKKPSNALPKFSINGLAILWFLFSIEHAINHSLMPFAAPALPYALSPMAISPPLSPPPSPTLASISMSALEAHPKAFSPPPHSVPWEAKFNFVCGSPIPRPRPAKSKGFQKKKFKRFSDQPISSQAKVPFFVPPASSRAHSFLE